MAEPVVNAEKATVGDTTVTVWLTLIMMKIPVSGRIAAGSAYAPAVRQLGQPGCSAG